MVTLRDRAGPGSTRGQGAGPPLMSPGPDPLAGRANAPKVWPDPWPDKAGPGRPSGQPGPGPTRGQCITARLWLGCPLLLRSRLLLLMMSGVGTLAFHCRELVCTLVSRPTMAFVLIEDCFPYIGERKDSSKVCVLKKHLCDRVPFGRKGGEKNHRLEGF
jgi:hypothetical protein